MIALYSLALLREPGAPVPARRSVEGQERSRAFPGLTAGVPPPSRSAWLRYPQAHTIREHLRHGISRPSPRPRYRGSEAPPGQHASASSAVRPGELTNEQALERYRYLVRTAPPDAIEQAHEEAFAKLTPEQRRLALRDASAAVPEHERTGGDDPRSLARMATRAETQARHRRTSLRWRRRACSAAPCSAASRRPSPGAWSPSRCSRARRR